MSKQAPEEIELRGDELGWIIKMAEIHNDSDHFKELREKYPKLSRFVNVVLAKFHPNNFNAGDNRVVWILKRKNIMGEEDTYHCPKCKHLLTRKDGKCGCDICGIPKSIIETLKVYSLEELRLKA